MPKISSGLLVILLLACTVPALAQFAGSDSNGSDGILWLTKPGELTFDPRTFEPALDKDGDNVYHFTKIYIAAGVTVKLSQRSLRGPVFWLAQDTVRIDGHINLDGDDGRSVSANFPPEGGAGGYGGGTQRLGGFGPGLGGVYVRNKFLVPLLGGPGGRGGEGCSGGRGGGALLIASSISVTVNGSITANGEKVIETVIPKVAGGGSIRLVAPVVDGAGDVSAAGGEPAGDAGWVRIETSTNNYFGKSSAQTTYGKPYGLFLPPDPQPSVRVVSLNGVAISGMEKQPLTLSQLNSRWPLNALIGVEGRSIPVGTVVEVELLSEDGAVQIAATTPLEGTFERSTASVNMAFPVGRARAYVRVNWDLAKTPRHSR